MKHTIQNSFKMWNDEHGWQEDGDEWKGQALKCGKPYAEWKMSVAERFIDKYVGKNDVVLEIAPGHGRWSEFFVKKVRKLILVDLSPKCISFCKERFAAFDNIQYHVNDGKSLSCVETDSVDFIWSFDSFVHISGEIIESYFVEFQRILKEGSIAVIHHAGRKNSLLWLGFLMYRSPWARRVYDFLSIGSVDIEHGWRSNVSKEMIARFARANKLEVLEQVNAWGEKGEFGIPRYNDCISILTKRLEN